MEPGKVTSKDKELREVKPWQEVGERRDWMVQIGSEELQIVLSGF